MTGFATWQFRVSRRLGRLITWLAAILTLGRMPPFVSASAIVVDAGKVLAVLDPGRGEPVLPGGHLAWREVPEEAVVREVEEETGYRVIPETLVGVFAGEDLAGELGVVRIIYSARILGGQLTSSHEGAALWMPIDEMTGSASRDATILRRWLAGRGLAADREE